MRDSTVPNISPMHFCYGTREILPIEHEMLRESGWICKTVLRLQIPKAGLPSCMSWKWRKDTCTRPARIHCNQTKKNTPRGGRRFQLKVTNSDKIGFVHLCHLVSTTTPRPLLKPAADPLTMLLIVSPGPWEYLLWACCIESPVPSEL